MALYPFYYQYSIQFDKLTELRIPVNAIQHIQLDDLMPVEESANPPPPAFSSESGDHGGDGDCGFQEIPQHNDGIICYVVRLTVKVRLV